MRKYLFIFLVSFILVSFTIFFSPNRNDSKSDKGWICVYPGLDLVEKGQSKDEVFDILGKPTEVIVKTSLDEQVFHQGDNEKFIKEGWIYKFENWNGGIEIYIDSNNLVLKKNCGYSGI